MSRSLCPDDSGYRDTADSPCEPKGHLSVQMPGRPGVPQPAASPTFSQRQLYRFYSGSSPLRSTPASKTSGARPCIPAASNPERKGQGSAFIETDAFPHPCLSQRGRLAGSTPAPERRFPAAPRPGPGTAGRTDRRTLTLGVAEAAAVADAGAAPPLHALQVLAVEEAAPAGGAGELLQHRVELAQRLRQIPAVLPRRCRGSGVRTGPDLPDPTLMPPPPAPGKGGKRRGEGRVPPAPSSRRSHLAPPGAGLEETSW